MAHSLSMRIEQLLQYALVNGLIEREDIIPSRNSLMDLMGIQEIDSDLPAVLKIKPLEKILEGFLADAVERGLIEDTQAQRDLFDTRLMGLLMPRASETRRYFDFLRTSQSVEKATEWFYRFCQEVNYIRMDRIRKNHHWVASTRYGDLEMTINLSKPEKDPRDIAAQKKAAQTNYPPCLLCIENAGYPGRIDHPARQNLRLIPLELDKEEWFFQYSPYVYYNEHCIVIYKDHVPMSITSKTFTRLLDFLELFPHYCIGSNADLPIVGGSILSHEHFQGGRHTFPMEKAHVKKKVVHPTYPHVHAGILDWPLSTLRLRSAHRQELLKLCSHILDGWRAYSDKTNLIWSHSVTDGQDIPHNTITPIARKVERDLYEIDLVLRNNRTTSDHPLGLFHPHEPYHHIKKENIGLIEVLGLAILPGRLEGELSMIEALLQADLLQRHEKKKLLPKEMKIHEAWMERLLLEHPKPLSAKEAKAVIQDEVARVFVGVLEDCGVFKDNPASRGELAEAGWKRFLDHLGFCVIAQ